MDFALNPEEQRVWEDARAAFPAIAGRAAEADRAARFPVESLDDLRRHGLMALAVPREHGGRGAPTTAYVLAAEAIAEADASLAIAWVMHTACGWEISQAARPDTRQAVLEEIVDGAAFICIAGADARAPDGSPDPPRAEPAGDGWQLNGRKGFASGSEAATYVLTGGVDPEGRRLAFLVRMDNPGVQIADRWDGMGMRASASHGLAFEGCAVPEAFRLAQTDASGDFRNTSALFGLGLAATALGIAQAALAFTIDWCANRELSEANRVRLGDMDLRVEAVRSLLWRAAWHAHRRPEAAEPWVDRAKTLAVEEGQRVTMDAMRVCGGSAFRRRYALERHARDSAALLLQGQRPDMLRVNLANARLAGPSGEGDHHPAAR